jgi:hypothetical protein
MPTWVCTTPGPALARTPGRQWAQKSKHRFIREGDVEAVVRGRGGPWGRSPNGGRRVHGGPRGRCGRRRVPLPGFACRGRPKGFAPRTRAPLGRDLPTTSPSAASSSSSASASFPRRVLSSAPAAPQARGGSRAADAAGGSARLAGWLWRRAAEAGAAMEEGAATDAAAIGGQRARDWRELAAAELRRVRFLSCREADAAKVEGWDSDRYCLMETSWAKPRRSSVNWSSVCELS